VLRHSFATRPLPSPTFAYDESMHWPVVHAARWRCWSAHLLRNDSNEALWMLRFLFGEVRNQGEERNITQGETNKDRRREQQGETNKGRRELTAVMSHV
jgi:hypothetical protein